MDKTAGSSSVEKLKNELDLLLLKARAQMFAISILHPP